MVANDTLGMWITVQVQAPGFPDLSSLEWGGENLPSLGETIRVHHPPNRPYPLRFGSAPRSAAALAGGVLVAVGFGLLLWGG